MLDSNLSQNRIEAGARLIAALREAKTRIAAAFWFQGAEAEEWRLVIVSPDVETEGPHHVLKLIKHELSKENHDIGIELLDVDVFDPQTPELLLLAEKQSDLLVATDHRLGAIDHGFGFIRGMYSYFFDRQYFVNATPYPILEAHSRLANRA